MDTQIVSGVWSSAVLPNLRRAVMGVFLVIYLGQGAHLSHHMSLSSHISIGFYITFVHFLLPFISITRENIETNGSFFNLTHLYYGS